MSSTPDTNFLMAFPSLAAEGKKEQLVTTTTEITLSINPFTHIVQFIYKLLAFNMYKLIVVWVVTVRTSHLGLTFNTVDEILWSGHSKDYTTTCKIFVI